MQLFIITGASKGLGFCLAEKALQDGHQVISISRTKTLKHEKHFHLTHDLSKSKGLETKLDKLLMKIEIKKVKAIHLINNAAVISPIGEIENLPAEEIETHIKTNLITPMVLSQWLMKTFKKKTCPINIVNISSGAAIRPLVDWSLYCSAKSGLKMFTDCLAQDYAEKKNFRAFSFSPGVMDTEMQSTIRKQSKKTFKNVDRFKELKQKNQLLSPDKVALGLYGLLESPEKLNQTFYDIRDLI